MTKFRKKLSVLLSGVLLSGLLVAALGASPAGAVTPAQTTGAGTVSTLYGDLNAFWRTNFTNWGIPGLYRAPTVWLQTRSTTACGEIRSPGAFACNRAPYIGQIWLGTDLMQAMQGSFGDYGAGVVLAHEWGHVMMYELGGESKIGQIGRELFADCLAGMYTHYGLLVSHKLNNSDYWEGYNTVRASAGGSHGTADQRSAWYQYGYTAYDIFSCERALG